jgi:hypothetical protein
MSIRNGKTRAQKRSFSGDDSQPVDIRTLLKWQSGYQSIVPHEDSQYKLDTQDVAIITMQPHPSKPVPQTQCQIHIVG